VILTVPPDGVPGTKFAACDLDADVDVDVDLSDFSTFSGHFTGK